MHADTLIKVLTILTTTDTKLKIDASGQLMIVNAKPAEELTQSERDFLFIQDVKDRGNNVYKVWVE